MKTPERSRPDPTARFSNRVENYIRYRPGYPPGVLEMLRQEAGLSSASIIADIGSGTGILSELLLRNGNIVYGVEPNLEMRGAAERLLNNQPGFRSVNGTAEATMLPNALVDFVTAGQAFHWFDMPAARREFLRILKPGGWVVLIWNERQTDSTPFLRAYEEMLLKHGTDYAAVRHENVTEQVLAGFFGGEYAARTFPNVQIFDEEGLRGRVLSSSYAPAQGEPGHDAIMSGLREIFGQYQETGRVRFEYHTRVYLGRLR